MMAHAHRGPSDAGIRFAIEGLRVRSLSPMLVSSLSSPSINTKNRGPVCYKCVHVKTNKQAKKQKQNNRDNSDNNNNGHFWRPISDEPKALTKKKKNMEG